MGGPGANALMNHHLGYKFLGSERGGEFQLSFDHGSRQAFEGAGPPGCQSESGQISVRQDGGRGNECVNPGIQVGSTFSPNIDTKGPAKVVAPFTEIC